MQPSGCSGDATLGIDMTITYDPRHPRYLDEADVRNELTRVFDHCVGCRKCVDLCSSFPTLFELVGRHADLDAGRLTPAQQDRVIDGCHQCMLCHTGCPYSPERHEWAVDVPRLMLRAKAMRRAAQQVPLRTRLADRVIGHADLLGRAASIAAPAVNRVVGARPGSAVRKAVEVATGLSSVRLLPPFARQRFTTWFARRPRVRIAKRQGRVAVFPTCVVEYQQPQIGHDLVKVYERNGIECSLAAGARCCGAPSLHAGDVAGFARTAERNVAALAASVRKGHDIVVPQPTCSYVIRRDYPAHVPGDDAPLVAERTYDAVEYLMRVHKGEGTSLDTEFTGFVPSTVTYHAPCHLRAQDIGLRSRDLLKLTGAAVKVVQRCSGIDGMWGLRAEHDEASIALAGALADEVRRAGGDVVAGDCHLANVAISEQTGEEPMHPLELLARAYGIPEEGPVR